MDVVKNESDVARPVESFRADTLEVATVSGHDGRTSPDASLIQLDRTPTRLETEADPTHLPISVVGRTIGGHTNSKQLCVILRSDFRQSNCHCVSARTSKKSCPAGFFDDNSSNNLTIEVGTHPGGWDGHRRSYKLDTTSCNTQNPIA